jgi:hypothetical protein
MTTTTTTTLATRAKARTIAMPRRPTWPVRAGLGSPFPPSGPGSLVPQTLARLYLPPSPLSGKVKRQPRGTGVGAGIILLLWALWP